jgi:hypothetical protein
MAACLKLQLQMEVTSGRLGILNVLGVFTGSIGSEILGTSLGHGTNF